MTMVVIMMMMNSLTACVKQAIEEPFITSIKHALVDNYSPAIDLIYRKSIKFILTSRSCRPTLRCQSLTYILPRTCTNQ